MKKVTKNPEATTERGTLVKLEVISERGFEAKNSTVSADGQPVDILEKVETKKDKVTLTINGKVYNGYFTRKLTADQLKGCYGAFIAGTLPIGLSEEVYNKLNNVVIEAAKEAETDNSWMELQAKKQATLKMEMKYQADTDKINKIMNQ